MAAQTSNSNLLDLKVHNRDELIFDGKVKSVSSINDKGKFDVLPQHANFISLVQGNLIIALPSGGTRQIAIKDAVMKVEGNSIDVFIGVRF